MQQVQRKKTHLSMRLNWFLSSLALAVMLPAVERFPCRVLVPCIPLGPQLCTLFCKTTRVDAFISTNPREVIFFQVPGTGLRF